MILKSIKNKKNNNICCKLIRKVGLLFSVNKTYFTSIIKNKWFIVFQIFILLYDGINPTIIALLPQRFIDSIIRGETFLSSFVYIILLTLISIISYFVHTIFHNYSEVVFEKARRDAKIIVLERNKKIYKSFFDLSTNKDVYQRALNYADNGGKQFYSLIIAFLVNFVSITSMIVAFDVIRCWMVGWLVLVGAYKVICEKKLADNNYEFNKEKVSATRKKNYFVGLISSQKTLSEICVNGGFDFFANKYRLATDEYIGTLKSHLNIVSIIKFVMFIISPIQTLIIYAYIGYNLIIGNLSMGEYTVILLSVTRLEIIISKMIEFPAKIYSQSLEAQNYNEYMNSDLECEIFDDNNVTNLNEINSIEFKNVSFSYPGSSKLVLDNVSFFVKKGELCTLVGINGAGKTTIINLLLKLYKPSSGYIVINGIPLSNISRQSLWKCVGTVYQHLTHYSISIGENITFDNNKSSEEVKSDLELVGISRSMYNDNIDTPTTRMFDNNGLEFSGGEWQRIAIARALSKNSSLMVLDEPTSALDAVMEDQIIQIIKKASSNRITLFVSHRMSSNMIADKIIFINEGRVEKIGSHTDLMENCPQYQDLFNVQATKYTNSFPTH